MERNQVQQDTANVSTNPGTNLEMLGRDTTYCTKKSDRVGADRQTSVQDICQRVTTSEDSINRNNRPPIQNIHREYSNVESNILSEGQFFAPQRRQTPGERKSKAVQVDHVEEQ